MISIPNYFSYQIPCGKLWFSDSRTHQLIKLIFACSSSLQQEDNEDYVSFLQYVKPVSSLILELLLFFYSRLLFFFLKSSSVQFFFKKNTFTLQVIYNNIIK